MFQLKFIFLAIASLSSCIFNKEKASLDNSSLNEGIPASYVLGNPTVDEESIVHWRKAINSAATEDDEKLACTIMDKERYDLDASSGIMYRIHVVELMSKNTKLFFRCGILKFGSIRALAEFLVDETGDYLPAGIEGELEKAPLKYQDKVNSSTLLSEARDVQEKILASHREYEDAVKRRSEEGK